MKRRRGRSLVSGTALVLATGAAFFAGSHLRHKESQPRAIQPVRVVQAEERGALTASASRPGGAPAPDVGGLDTFDTVYQLVKRHYADPLPSDTKLARGAVKAMIGRLEDPNSYFLEPAQRTLLETESEGRFEGIGAALFVEPQKKEGYTDHKIVVVAPLGGSPAEKAGLKPGDIITRIDGKWVLGYNPLVTFTKVYERWQGREVTDEELEKARDAARTRIESGVSLLPAQMLLRGDKSVKALASKPRHTLTIERPGAKAPLTIEVETGTTRVSPVSHRLLEGGALYLRIALFTDAAVEAVKGALATLPAGAAGIVLDLRGNPGGAFESAQKIAGLLAGAGPFATEVGPKSKPPVKLLSAAGNAPKVPITVLIDRGTASTAEALAIALAERGVASLAGEKSFGDALVVGLFPLDDGSGFTLTTGKLVSPKGIAWAGAGLTPDVPIAAGTPEEQILSRAVAALRLHPRVAVKPS